MREEGALTAQRVPAQDLIAAAHRPSRVSSAGFGAEGPGPVVGGAW